MAALTWAGTFGPALVKVEADSTGETIVCCCPPFFTLAAVPATSAAMVKVLMVWLPNTEAQKK